MRRKLILMLVSGAAAGLASAEIINVPQDFDVIQDAIDHAQGGDTIIVDHGEYTENLDFGGRGLILASRFLLDRDPEHIANTVIDGDGQSPVVQFTRGENTAKLIGFTLRNGYAQGRGGGGVYCDNASPSLFNLVIENCRATRGGGILCWNSNAQIGDVTLRDNQADAHGGGICLMENSSALIADAQITGNQSGETGGGVSSFSSGQPTLENAVVADNITEGIGGGVYFQGRGTVRTCTVTGNYAGQSGGGMASEGDLAVFSTIIAGNECAGSGGGIVLAGGRPTLFKAEVTANSTEGDGGGLLVVNAAPNLNFLTLCANTAEGDGGACFAADNARLVVFNSIVRGNSPQGVYFSAQDAENTLTIAYTDLEDGRDGIVTNDNARIYWGDGMIDADPLFADPDAGDYHLTWAHYPEEDETKSPCIDAGSPEDEDDPDGTPPDMGAYYFHQYFPHLVVEPDFFHYGVIDVGDTARAQFTLSNTGRAPLHVTGQVVTPEGGPFIILEGGGEASLDSGETVTTVVGFAPPRRQQYQGTYTIASNDPELPRFEILLFGSGANRAPYLNHPLPDVVVDEDPGVVIIVQDLAADSVFADPDGDELSYEVLDFPWQLNVRIIGGLRLEFQPALNFNLPNGADVAVGADDHHGGQTADTFRITVNPVNDPPNPFALTAPPDSSVLDSPTALFQWRTAPDPESDRVAYRFSLSLPLANRDTVLAYPWQTDTSLFLDRLDTVLSGLGFTEKVNAQWWVTASDGRLERRSSTVFHLVLPKVTSAPPEPAANLPDFRLAQPRPNPLNGIAAVEFELPRPGLVKLLVTDAAGHMVSVLEEGFKPAGTHRAVWNARSLPAGVYLVHLDAGGDRRIRKVVLVR